MEIDSTTLYDLSILHADDQQSILHQLDHCHSEGGRTLLKHLLTHPHKTLAQIRETEEIIRLLIPQIWKWPPQISNGTIQVIDRFLCYPFGSIPHSSFIAAYLFPFFHQQDHGMIRFSVPHLIDFIKGMSRLTEILSEADESLKLKELRLTIEEKLSHPLIQHILHSPKDRLLGTGSLLRLAHFFYQEGSIVLRELSMIFFRLDAWQSMATAFEKLQFRFPVWNESQLPVLRAEGLFHPLLTKPVSNDVSLNQDSTFLFLTGANMAGKSTFIKALGVAVYLAHVGIGCPARTMNLSVFKGLITNIQVQDNLSKGESYFFNEVQRIKTTITKIKAGGRWLVLIDELFKGTNIQDAMLCSQTIIEGLIKLKRSLFVLSTHLYEIGDELKKYPAITCSYFETRSDGEQLQFSYQLKPGISKDRFGFLILKNEKVTELLEGLKDTE